MSSWLNLVFKLIELPELVLSLLEFCDKLIEFGCGDNRWRVSIWRDFCYTRVD